MSFFTKQPSEVFTFDINYNPWLDTGETISSGILLVDNANIGSSGSIIDSWSISSPKVYITVSGGVDNTDYLITSQIYTSESNTYEYDVNLKVRENASCVYVNDDFSYRLTFDSSSNKLYILPSPDSSFKKNTQYKILIKKGLSGYDSNSGIITLGSDYEFYFTTEYCPLFTTVGRVKLLAGPDADFLIEDTIYRMIYKNSLDAVQLYNINTGNNVSATYWGCDMTNVPYKLVRYVECKTAYDILALIRQVNTSNGGGNQSKTLGDMTIKYTGGSSYSNPSLTSPDKLKELYDCWNEMLRTFKSIDVAVRGYYDTSKGFAHPVREPQHNRVIRPVIRNVGSNNPRGAWEKGFPWRRFDTV